MTRFADRFDIRKLLGEGSFGVVYLAHDTLLDRDVALKLLHPALTVDAATVRLFTREAGTLAKLDHDNIVPVHDMGVSDGARYIVMRHVPGRSLAQVLADEGPQPPARVAAWLAQIADGLDFAHSRGVLHRDLKPSNLLLDEERGRVLISDFGLARAVENSGGSSSDQSRHSMTGTVLYMAPEILQGGAATPASDLYGLGCVLYELLAGTPPYTGDNPMAIGFQHVQADVPALDLPGTEGRALAAQVAALMAKDPAQRPDNAKAAVDALTSTLVATTDEPPQPDEPPIVESSEQGTLWTPTIVNVSDVEPLGHPIPTLTAVAPDRTRRMRPRVLLGFVAFVAMLAFWLMGPFSPLGDEAQPAAMLTAVHTPTPCPANTVRREGQCTTLTPTKTPTSTPTKTPTTAEPAAGTVREFYGIPFVYVPAGEFIMGSSDAELDTALDLCDGCPRGLYARVEQPQHTVYLDGYWIMQTEVTNAQYGTCVDAGACRMPGNGRWGNDTYMDHPVTDVSWDDGVAYAAWLSDQAKQTIRLPTEAEWEKAARGTDARVFPWGNAWDGTRLNYCDRNCTWDWPDMSVDDGYEETAPVGRYPEGESPYGALDMAGNVNEWTADCRDEDYYVESPSRNPTGSNCEDSRVMRGGSWVFGLMLARATYGLGEEPDVRRFDLGLRLASPGY